MKIAGIITEYNPMHNGHLYHIEETRRLSNCDVLICVMSGNFTQRGEPAIIDKFTRTRIALQNKVDLVVELPFVFSVQSADMFAYTSVNILNHLGVTDIYFGSESGEIKDLETLADLIGSEKYNDLVKEYLAEGYSYPTSSDKAVRKLTNSNIYDSPNNILGIQYIRAQRKLNKELNVHTFKRTKAGYYSGHVKGTNIQSATMIRELMLKGEEYKQYVPKNSFEVLKERKFVSFDSFIDQLKYMIRSTSAEELSHIFSIKEGLENRILKVHDFDDVNHLVLQIISRRYTNSKIKRSLVHMLCNTKNELITTFDVPYLRILGMNKEGQGYLNSIKKDLEIPLITKIGKEKHPYLEQELRASKVYSLASDIDVFKEEFKPVIIL
jgi:predicted nucleotidyltransferase